MIMRNCLGVLVLTAALAMLAGPADAWYPSTPLSELGTATW
jgi:hypothetical protein